MKRYDYINKKIVLYARRNTGLLALIYLMSKKKKWLQVISDDKHIIEFAKNNKIELVTLDTMGDYNLFICVHGNKIIPKKYLKDRQMFNIHPMLAKYPGKDPINKYIKNKDTSATVDSHYMTEIVDGGERIHCEEFETGVVSSYAEFYNIAFPYYIKCLEATMDKISGSVRGEPNIMPEILGKKYGRLTVIGFSKWVGKRRMIKTECDCGKEKDVDYSALKSGATQSCGCLALEKLEDGRRSRTKHNHGTKGAQSNEFRTWCSMKARCYNKNNKAYHNYGGRGIFICDRWLGENGFVNFIQDMGSKPTKHYTIERINNDKGYSPDNCKWATMSEQAKNKRPRKDRLKVDI